MSFLPLVWLNDTQVHKRIRSTSELGGTFLYKNIRLPILGLFIELNHTTDMPDNCTDSVQFTTSYCQLRKSFRSHDFAEPLSGREQYLPKMQLAMFFNGKKVILQSNTHRIV